MTQTRQTYVDAYRRTRQLEHVMSERLRQTILIPYFGGCGCRLHNCLVNYESGRSEWPVNGKSHKELAQLARRYNYEQRRIWDRTTQLADHFAKNF